MGHELLQSMISVHSGDLPSYVLKSARNTSVVAWDIETSGLDWKKDKIGTCQIFVPHSQVHLVQITDAPHPRLESLLNDPNICKIFHHAPFDLRFMMYQWSADAKNIVCTKISSKILEPSQKSHSLKQIIQQYLHTSLDKTLQMSNWLAQDLTDEQIEYAVRDVLYLPQLFSLLKKELVKSGRWNLAQASFDYLPIRTKLDVLGAADVFEY